MRISDAEIGALAGHFQLADREFREIYTRLLPKGEISLREKSTHECIFFDRERGCTIYALRPRQCRTWPFWSSVVFSEERWREESEDCPGMDQGPLHPAEEIQRVARRDGTR